MNNFILHFKRNASAKRSVRVTPRRNGMEVTLLYSIMNSMSTV